MKVREIINGLANEYDIPIELCAKIFSIAFASFLHRERRRHEDDIRKINVDLKVLARKDIHPIYIPLETWIDTEEIP